MITPYVTYDLFTGAVLQSGAADAPEIYARPGRGVLTTAAEVDPNKFKVDLSGPEPTLTPVDQSILDAAEFEQMHNFTKRRVADLVSSARTHFITSLPGQDAIYQAKYEEAVAYQADPSPDMAEYPFLSAEIGVTAVDASDIATIWVALRTGWIASAAAIENARLIANAALASATTVAALEAAEAQLRASLDAIVATT